MKQNAAAQHVGPPEQQALHARHFHHSGDRLDFEREELGQPIPARFEHQVRKHRGRTAIKTVTDELTYAEFNSAANRLAMAILDSGGKGSEPVMLLIRQSSNAILGIMGTMKAGKFYVPVDPAQPEPRIRYLLDDSRARLVVTDSEGAELARRLVGGDGQVLDIDTLDDGLSDDNVDVDIPLDSLAYVAYTSGSTGSPKGVMHAHRDVMHAVWEFTSAAHISYDDRLLLVPNYSAGAAGRSIFASLLNGATLMPFDVRAEGTQMLARWMAQEQTTIFHCNPPTLFRSLLEALDGSVGFPSLRLVRLAGETVHMRDVELFKKHMPDTCVLLIALASTETGTTTVNLVDSETELEPGPLPVGYPALDKEVLLLDEKGDQVEPSEVGEIAVKSSFISPGYWRRPDLTEAAFLPAPDADKRIYRTGDLGRFTAEGALIHLGRKDFQVKVRGFKVEPLEIEVALTRHPAVEAAAVVAQDDGHGQHRVAAYIVASGGAAPTATSLRRTLAETLPDYRIPSSFTTLESLPLTATGKIDRLALPTPDGTRPELDAPFLAPRTPVEEALAHIWADVLGLDQVGIDDDFMELGGDSLRASQVVSRVTGELGVDIPLRSLFQASTVAYMALAVTQGYATQTGDGELASVLAELEDMSPEQVRKSLADQKGPRTEMRG